MGVPFWRTVVRADQIDDDGLPAARARNFYAQGTASRYADVSLGQQIQAVHRFTGTLQFNLAPLTNAEAQWDFSGGPFSVAGARHTEMRWRVSPNFTITGC